MRFLTALVLFILISGCQDKISISDTGKSDTTIPILKSWKASLPVSFSNPHQLFSISASYPSVAVNENGDAIIVWLQNDGASDQIYKSELRNGVWRHPTGLEERISPAGTRAWSPQAAINNSGEIIITWQQSDGTNDQVYKSEYRLTTGWHHPTSLSDNISLDSEVSFFPKAAISNDGSAIIV